jgi:AraC family transcriptional regulator of adaptative response / DNA-3-methyladenine glycosylase II
VDGAETLLRALIPAETLVAVGSPLPQPDGSLTTLFPTAATVAQHVTGTALKVSSAIAEGALDVHVGSDADELAAALASYGVDAETIALVQMRVLGSPDVLLSTVDNSAAWSPWRSYASMHLRDNLKR